MFTGPVGPVEVFFYWPEAVLGNFYWPGAIGLPLASSPAHYKWMTWQNTHDFSEVIIHVPKNLYPFLSCMIYFLKLHYILQVAQYI